MAYYAGQADTHRSMSLLWRSGGGDGPSGPGPKPGLSVDAIVRAAIAIADADGMGALSMRTVGERLGRTGMALYTYVPNKKELVDLMYDSVLGELPSSYALDSGWRPALTAWADDMRAFYVRHPWALSFSQARPVLGPNEFAVRETLARILRATGLPAGRVRSVFGLLFHYVRGAAQTVAEARQAPADTGLTDEEWWLARTTLLRQVVPDIGERYPAATWLETPDDDSPELDPDDADLPYLERRGKQTFAAGLTVILDGIEAMITRTSGRQPD